MDVFKWKVIPERFGGARNFARGLKNAWVINHRTLIKSAEMLNKLPPELLAGEIITSALNVPTPGMKTR
ncbi:hypothetical protein [Kosakonia sp. 1610]|uniref:hypothetical protein n=1 Tax=Kosakonia sp. 1610 TaxID=3156426 RepID=UPI003D1ED8DA